MSKEDSDNKPKFNDETTKSIIYALREMDFIDDDDAICDMDMSEVIERVHKARDHLLKLQEQDD